MNYGVIPLHTEIQRPAAKPTYAELERQLDEVKRALQQAEEKLKRYEAAEVETSVSQDAPLMHCGRKLISCDAAMREGGVSKATASRYFNDEWWTGIKLKNRLWFYDDQDFNRKPRRV